MLVPRRPFVREECSTTFHVVGGFATVYVWAGLSVVFDDCSDMGAYKQKNKVVP
jgi:hypothetical protein